MADNTVHRHLLKIVWFISLVGLSNEQMNICEIYPEVCKNGGTCFQQGSGESFNLACTCSPTFTGVQCELAMEEDSTLLPGYTSVGMTTPTIVATETTTSKSSTSINTTPPDTTFFTTPINTNSPVTTFVAMEEDSTMLPGYTSVGMTTPTMVATETTTSKSSTSINTTPPDTTFSTTPINTNPPITTFVAMEEDSTMLPGYTSVGMTTPTMVATETTTSKSSTSINTALPVTTLIAMEEDITPLSDFTTSEMVIPTIFNITTLINNYLLEARTPIEWRCHLCNGDSNCMLNVIPFEVCNSGETCVATNVTATLILGTRPIAITQVFRACFPRTLTPTHNGCIDGKAFFDLAGSLVPSIKFQDETGTACFCESELCNNQSLPRDTPI
ncbi:uncharacterized protein [Apostichopus japonicus]|uniref:uncharacterized protein n=1 Tax=Stichopus japonicus TaxID=307972 RepID=UPI003AB4D8C6